MKPPVSPETILILKPSSLGDIIHTLPSAALIRRRWPEARLIWMVNPEWAPILENNPLRIEPWIFPRRRLKGVWAPARYLAWLNRRNFKCPDLALDFQGLLRSALTGKLTFPKTFLGLSDAREYAGYFYHQAATVEEEHAVDRYRKLAELATGTPALTQVEFPLPEGVPMEGIRPEFIVLHPFSRGAGKSLTPDWVTAFCGAVAPTRVLLVGKSVEAVELPQNATDLLNRTTLPQLLWLLTKASAVVSVDSGPMHLAAAVGTPLLALHGWSDPRLVGPYSKNAAIWKGGRITSRAESQNTSSHSLPGIGAIPEITRHVRTLMDSHR